MMTRMLRTINANAGTSRTLLETLLPFPRMFVKKPCIGRATSGFVLAKPTVFRSRLVSGADRTLLGDQGWKEFSCTLPGCLSPAYRHTYLCIYLSYVDAYLYTYIPMYIHIYMYAYTYVQKCLCTYLCTYIPMYIPMYIRMYKHTYVHTWVQTYLCTNIPMYRHTYAHTYSCRYIYV